MKREDKGIKHDQGKPDWTLLDKTAIDEVAKVLMFGAQKYERDNWRKGLSKERLLAGVYRHIASSNNGELKDPESGISHLAHAICGLMFALHFEVKNDSETAHNMPKPKAQRKNSKLRRL